MLYDKRLKKMKSERPAYSIEEDNSFTLVSISEDGEQVVIDQMLKDESGTSVTVSVDYDLLFSALMGIDMEKEGLETDLDENI